MIKRYQGEFADDLRHGKGTFYYANGSKYEGYWSNGIKDGKTTLYSNACEIQSLSFSMDKPKEEI